MFLLRKYRHEMSQGITSRGHFLPILDQFIRSLYDWHMKKRIKYCVINHLFYHLIVRDYNYFHYFTNLRFFVHKFVSLLKD